MRRLVVALGVVARALLFATLTCLPDPGDRAAGGETAIASGDGGLRLVIDDAKAVYPVRVDPMILDFAESWVRRYNGPDDGEDEALDLGVTSAGNVVVTGGSTGNAGDLDYVTIQYDTTGGQQWLARYDGTGGGRDEAADVALDGSGNALVAGLTDVTPGGGTDLDYLLLQIDGPARSPGRAPTPGRSRAAWTRRGPWRSALRGTPT